MMYGKVVPHRTWNGPKGTTSICLINFTFVVILNNSTSISRGNENTNTNPNIPLKLHL